MKPVAVRHIERADAATIDRLGELGVATVHEAQGRTGLLKPYIRPIYPRARVDGTDVRLEEPGATLGLVHRRDPQLAEPVDGRGVGALDVAYRHWLHRLLLSVRIGVLSNRDATNGQGVEPGG